MHPSYIRTDSEFLPIVQRLEGQSEICLDCEFHSEGRYHPNLCLVQVAFGDEIWAIDAHRVDLTRLAPVLQDEAVRKVLHDGRQDLPILARAAGISELPNVFDTQIAAAFAGHGGSVGYGALVRELYDVELDKSLQVSDWTRQLSDAQIEYALDDVRYLSRCSTHLRALLASNGRLEWTLLACAEAALRALGRPDPDKLYRRVSSISRLNPSQLGILREVAKWRDHVAQAIDRPIPSVANDLALKAIALQPPRDLRALEAVRGLGVGRGQPWASALLEAVAQGAKLPEAQRRILLSREQEARVEGLASLLGIARRFVAIRDGIASELLADQAELRSLAEWHLAGQQSELSVGVLQGWRRTVLGELLLSVLSGEIAFRADAGAPTGLDIVQLGA